MRALLAYFSEENPRRILIPRGRLLLFWGLLFLLASVLFLLWNGIFIVVSLFCVFVFLYLARFGFVMWRQYYAGAWYVVFLLMTLSAALGVRVFAYTLFS